MKQKQPHPALLDVGREVLFVTVQTLQKKALYK